MTEIIYSVGQLKAMLKPIFLRNDVRKAVLFGSYSKGEASSKSDIDIYVDSGLRGLDFFGLLEDIVCAVDKKVDLIDVDEVLAGTRVAKEIETSGVVLYEK